MKGIQGRVFVRALSLVLAFVLVFSYVPMKPVFAEGTVEETEAPVEAAAVDAEVAGDENAVETGTANEVANENENDAFGAMTRSTNKLPGAGTVTDDVTVLMEYEDGTNKPIPGAKISIKGALCGTSFILGEDYYVTDQAGNVVFKQNPRITEVFFELPEEWASKVEAEFSAVWNIIAPISWFNRQGSKNGSEGNSFVVGMLDAWDDLYVKIYLKAKKFDVKFDLGYDESQSTTETVEYLRTVKQPEDPTRDEYTFLGWFEDGAERSFDFNTPIDSDKTLYARWGENQDPEYTKEVHFYFLKEEYSGEHDFATGSYTPDSSGDLEQKIVGSMTTTLHDLSNLCDTDHYYDENTAPDGTEARFYEKDFVSGATYKLGETTFGKDNATEAIEKELAGKKLIFKNAEVTIGTDKLKFTPFAYSWQESNNAIHVDVMLERKAAAALTVRYYLDDKEDESRKEVITGKLAGDIVTIEVPQVENYNLVEVKHGEEKLQPTDGKYEVKMTDTESDVHVYYKRVAPYEITAEYYLAIGSDLDNPVNRGTDYYTHLFGGAIKSVNDLKGNKEDIYFQNDVYDGYTFLDANGNEVTNETLTTLINSKGKITYDGETFNPHTKVVKAVIHRITRDHGKNVNVDIRLEIKEKDVASTEEPEQPVNPGDDNGGNTGSGNGDDNGGNTGDDNGGTAGGDDNNGGDNTGGGGSTGGGTNTDADEDYTVTIDDEDTPLGGVENGDDAAADSDADVNSDSADVVVDLDDEDTPLGGAELPYTAQHTDTFYYAIGAVLVALGLLIRRMTK